MLKSVVLLLTALAVAVPALAAVTPHETVLTLSYGNAVGQLDTTLVSADDPSRTLVQSFRVEENGTAWVFPRWEVAGQRTVLLCYERGAFAREVPFTGYTADFLLAPDGVYSWGPAANEDVAAQVAFDPGNGEVRYAKLPASAVAKPGFAGWLESFGGNPCLVGRGEGNHLFTVRLSRGLSSAQLSSQVDVDRGVTVPGASGGPVWQDTKLVKQGTRPVYDIGLQEGTLVAVFPDAGFVIRRPGERNGDTRNPVFEIRNATGDLVRTVVTLPRTDQFGVGTPPWIFTPQHVYQLLLGPAEGQLVRY